jgi:hypothetical protein
MEVEVSVGLEGGVVDADCKKICWEMYVEVI